MSLINSFKERCVLLEKHRTSDGEGGFVTTWSEGPEFSAAIVHNQSLQARVAEKQGVTALYEVTVDKNVEIDFHDAFKRIGDGQVFRVTSNAKEIQTPSVASFSFAKFTAEEWRLPS